MRGWLVGVGENMVSTALISIFAVTAAVLLGRRARRYKYTFFGLTSSKKVVIVTSRYVPPTKVELTEDGAQSVGYVGATIAEDEVDAALRLKELFDSSEVEVSLRSFASALLSGSKRFEVVTTSIQPATEHLMPNDGCVILLGTGAHSSNAPAKKLLDGSHSFRYRKGVRGAPDEDSQLERYFERVAKPHLAHDIKWVNDFKNDRRHLAVIERITRDHGSVVFLCAGSDDLGTKLAALYLAENWRLLQVLHKENENGDFGRLYSFGDEPGDVQKVW